ncbi:hypothetical protein RN001_006439 [Aquatica leii]|uniref:Single domain-containing protein n=1 Tax=Aquatica leii TaxID=1421715 RepID=A0AAN7P807_9COLE|nr:hypothetical protein RN001_006439 [Aquatica leii]
MSHKSFQFIVLTFSLLFVFDVWNFPHHSHDHGKHCHTKSSHGVIHIDVEQSIPIPGKCLQATCEKNLTVTEVECVPLHLKPGCKATKIDYAKLYPICCPVLQCDHI